MKNLYTKGKGRIHPSPGATTGSSHGEALAVLRLLPAAILSLTAALGNDDKEVLAYLIMRSIGGSTEFAGKCRNGKPGEPHGPLFDCGCFECYTSFWYRWDCSPDSELIHQAIEAFEDHLASSERGVKGRRRERRILELSEKGKRKGKEKVVSSVSTDETRSEEGAAAVDVEDVEVEVAASEGETEIAADQMAMTGAEQRRKGWPDVTSFFNSRLWSLWSPGE
ncbi:hypothetical protein HPP92_005965 [Vanilla planifolia]|uniref:Uncharacterized protein n=1 Tax=Vanilla planifolia TaxID=51239 RepID=A0A835RUN1_VANPL|nr:hypothetical protein HPP92_005965 [Vanilla planifolia]